jgi:DNA polymerase
MDLYLDLETYSTEPITRGSYRYAQQVEILLFAWAIDDEPVRVEDMTRGDPLPLELFEALSDPTVNLIAHNSMFDRVQLAHDHRTEAIPMPIGRWQDTMVQALAHSLPGALGELCDVLRVDGESAKLDEGRELIHLFCKPRKDGGRNDWGSHPAEWARFIYYAGRDIDAMRACRKRMPRWNLSDREVAFWQLDQAINDRGIGMDIELATKAVAACATEKLDLAAQAYTLTDGRVESATKRAQVIREVLEQHGVALPDLRKATLETRINDENLPQGVRELLRVRLQASTSSVSKFQAVLNSHVGGRLMGTKQFCGAGRTGRWAGRLFQPDNLPLPSDTAENIAIEIDSIKAGAIHLLSDNVMKSCSNALRGLIVPRPGNKLVVADLSNIEGRDQAWLAGEEWKLQAFRDYDAGTGPDLYKLAYANSFGISPDDVDKQQRQVGKVQELALGFEGGVAAYCTFAEAYSIDLDEMAERAWGHIPGVILGQANIMLDWHRSRKRNPPVQLGLAERTWLVCESFKIGWRAAHPNIKVMWRRLQEAYRTAVAVPGKTFKVGQHLGVRRDGAWLRIILPSGRSLCYPSPSVREKDDLCAHCDGTGNIQVDGFALDCPHCEGTGKTQSSNGSLSYYGRDGYSKKWRRIHTYGGKLFENVCQAVARDVLAWNMPAIEQAGYQIVLTVHDEVVCEAPKIDTFNVEHLSSLLAKNQAWCADMPLAAAGFEGLRYRKD